MNRIVTVETTGELTVLPEGLLQALVAALEAGQILFFPYLAFPFTLEGAMLAAAAAAVAKNVSFDPARGVLSGVRKDAKGATVLRDALSAFAQFSKRIVTRVLPRYAGELVQGRTSFRPAEINGRQTSWRKDDTRLHVDSFPATPVHGRRILRFFSNVNPYGEARNWRVGEPFPQVANHFLPRLKAPLPGSAAVMHALRVTKTRRTPYDAYMLQLHDCMKADLDYQVRADQRHVDFPAGSSWMVYTDAVPHAAMSGRFAFEQTFYLPVAAMEDPARSPLRILERLTGKALV